MARSPLRISFAGGGTDLREFYASETGAVTGATIDRYVYVGVGRHFGGGVRVSYSQTENVARASELRHPIAREALNLLGVDRGVEIVSIADIPAGTGLGSSSSFTVGLLGALHAFLGRPATAREIAAEACRIEMDLLGEPIGKQDQHLCAIGGLQHIRFHPDERVSATRIRCHPDWTARLEAGLMLLYTGVSRRAGDILAGQAAATRAGLRREPLRRLRRLATACRDLLRRGGDLPDFGQLLDDAWRCKRGLSPDVSNEEIDARYARALSAGALGGKLLGAGGGGFLLLCCLPEQRAAVREAVGLPELPFRFERRGTRLHDLREEGAPCLRPPSKPTWPD